MSCFAPETEEEYSRIDADLEENSLRRTLQILTMNGKVPAIGIGAMII
jgi:hypothetical protein